MNKLSLGDRLTLAVLTFIGLLGICGLNITLSGIIAGIEFIMSKGR